MNSLLKCIKNGIFGRIRRSIVTVCVLVALIALTLLNSFAKDPITSVTSPMTEPVPSVVVNGTQDVVTLYYVVQWNQSYNSNNTYKLYEMIVSVPHGSVLSFRVARQNTGLYAVPGSISSYTINQYDIQTGYLIGSYETNSISASWIPNSCFYGFANSYFPENNASADICAGGYPILPEGTNLVGNTNTVYNSTPFVTWSLNAPDAVVYKSSLSEPVADDFNSYFIANNELFWLSYRFNGLYSVGNNIEIESQTCSSSGSYSDSGSGTYAGSQNGYTEEFTLTGDEVLVSSGGSGGYIGAWRSDPAQLDYVGVSQGTLHQSSNGTFTYNDTVVYPVSVDQALIHRLFDIVIVQQSDHKFYFRIYPNQEDLNGYIVDVDLYVSSFDLRNGKYVSSQYSNYNGALNYCGFAFEYGHDQDGVHSVRCYGCHYYNVNNLPVNLSSVLWQYDVDFEEWRDQMLSVLTNIYNVLSQDHDVPEPESYQDWQSELAGAEQTYSNVSPADIKLQLNNALADGNYGSVAAVIKSWVNAFSIPQLITLCVVALALGTVTLTLGKKKSE